MKPMITKLRQFRHRQTTPLCLHCLEKYSTGWTSHGVLGCVMCQYKVDMAIEANFEVVKK